MIASPHDPADGDGNPIFSHPVFAGKGPKSKTGCCPQVFSMGDELFVVERAFPSVAAYFQKNHVGGERGRVLGRQKLG